MGRQLPSTRAARVDTFIEGMRVPALKIARFAFTSATEF